MVTDITKVDVLLDNGVHFSGVISFDIDLFLLTTRALLLVLIVKLLLFFDPSISKVLFKPIINFNFKLVNEPLDLYDGVHSVGVVKVKTISNIA